MGKYLKKEDKKGLCMTNPENGESIPLTNEGNGIYSLTVEGHTERIKLEDPPGAYIPLGPGEEYVDTAKVNIGNEVVTFTVQDDGDYSGYTYSVEMNGETMSGYCYIDEYEVYLYTGETTSQQNYMTEAMLFYECVVSSVKKKRFNVKVTESTNEINHSEIRGESDIEIVSVCEQTDQEIAEELSYIDGDGYYCVTENTTYKGKYIDTNRTEDVEYRKPYNASSYQSYNKTAKIMSQLPNEIERYVVDNIVCRHISTTGGKKVLSAATTNYDRISYINVSTENYVTDIFPAVMYNGTNKHLTYNPPSPKLIFSGQTTGSSETEEILVSKTWSECKFTDRTFNRFKELIKNNHANHLDYNVKLNGEYPTYRLYESSSYGTERIVFSFNQRYLEYVLIIDASNRTIRFSYMSENSQMEN